MQPGRLLQIALLVAGMTLAGQVAGLIPHDGCSAAKAVPVPGLGPSCPVEDGWRVRLPDGETVLTHGPDPAAGEDAPSHENIGMVGPERGPKCAAEGTYRGVVIYAHARDLDNDYDLWSPWIRHMALTAGGVLRTEAETVGRTATYRLACDGQGRVQVDDVTLAMDGKDAAFWTIVGALKDQGYDDKREKYWVFYDGGTNCGCSGTATVHRDDRPRADNRNNRGPDWAVTYGLHPQTFMHENAHNLGAVQNNAPHASGSWHCNDGRDVMCYADGGPKEDFKPAPCLDRAWFDCRHDDYFHPDPPDGSYLATHWNLGHPRNRFIEFADVEQVPSPPVLTAGPGASDEEVDLEWLAPQHEGASAVDGYTLYRGVESVGFAGLSDPGPYRWSIRARLPAGATSYTDSVEPGTSYAYRIAAVNGFGEGGLSETVPWAAGEV